MDHPSTIQFSGAVARNTEQKGQKVAVHCAPPIDFYTPFQQSAFIQQLFIEYVHDVLKILQTKQPFR